MTIMLFVTFSQILVITIKKLNNNYILISPGGTSILIHIGCFYKKRIEESEIDRETPKKMWFK